MQSKDAIKIALKSTQDLLNMFVSDLSDADIQAEAVPGSNSIASQISHLIATEPMLAELLPNVKYPSFPLADPASIPAGKLKPVLRETPKKAQLLEMYNQVRSATIAAVEKLSDADFDKPSTGPMAQWAPNLGAMLQLTANHTMMHAGQFSVVRRALKKPVLF